MIQPVTELEHCSPAAHEMFRQLWAAHERAQRDLQVAWTAWCHGRGLPVTTALEGLSSEGLIVTRPAASDE
jgi:hypothetical protein